MKKITILFVVTSLFAVSTVAEETAIEETGVVEFYRIEKKPEPLTKVLPDYPEEAKKAGQAGTAIIEALVDVDGSISATKLLKSSGFEALDTCGLEAASKWTFTPAELEGKPVKVWVTIPFNFNLSDGKSSGFSSPSSQPSSDLSPDTPLEDTTDTKPEPDSTDVWNLDLTPQIKPLEVVKKVEAEYSEEFKEKGYEGAVLVKVLIGTDGKVEDADVLETSGYPDLDEAAIKAALQFEFTPPQHVSGTPVMVEGILTFNFSLEAGQEETPSRTE